jgi:hypothetical protein
MEKLIMSPSRPLLGPSLNACDHARIGRESEISPAPIASALRHQTYGMNARHTPLDCVQFNFDEIDARLLAAHDPDEDTIEEAILRAELEEGRASIGADVIREMVRMMIGEDRKTFLSNGFLRSISLRFTALAWLLEMEGIGEKSLTEIAAEIGTSKAVLSVHVRHLNRVFGMMCRGQKSTASREAYREATINAWREGRKTARRSMR